MNDKLIENLINSELNRQCSGLELIPSENYVSKDVLAALSSVYTNKYSEGYPEKRYYGGQEFTDALEQDAIDSAKKIFNSDHANVQPHSGAQANAAAFYSWLDYGDTILSMALDHGGHLTHGHPTTVLAKHFKFIQYGMKDIETGEIDFNALRDLAKTHNPKIILAGYSAYPRDLDYAKYKEIADECGAVLMADVAHIAGLIAGGVMKNPMDFGFNIMTSTTHKTLRGPRGGLILTSGVVSNPLKKPDKTVMNIPTLVDRTVFPGLQGGPHMNVIAAKAVCFHEALKPDFKKYAEHVVNNAKTLAEHLMKHGCKLITNGTDNHLILIDMVKSFGIDGDEAQKILDNVGLNANKNAIPNDINSAFKPSGLRLGTPAITTRGLVKDDMDRLAKWIVDSINNRANQNKLNEIKSEVEAFSKQYPVPHL